jgi:hypothetical protein
MRGMEMQRLDEKS